MSAQAAGVNTTTFGDVSGGKIIGAGGGAGSIIGETVEVNGPVIHIHGVTEEGARTLREILRVSPEVAAGRVPAAPTGETGTLVRAGIEEMLQLMRSAAHKGLRALHVDTGAVQFSAMDLLLRKATLLVAEANALTVAANTPEKAEVARRMDQGALGEMLAGHDSAEARQKLREALEALDEARQLAPDSTAVMLQMAQVLGRLHPDGSPEEGELLDEVVRRVATPRTDEQRLHRAQAMYLLGTQGRNRDVDLLREARAQFAALGRVDWMRQCDQELTAAESLPRRHRQHVPMAQAPTVTGTVGRAVKRMLYVAAGILFLFVGGYAVLIMMALSIDDVEPVPGLLPPQPQVAQPQVAAAFQPTGSWEVHFADGSGSVLNLDLLPGGSVAGNTFIENVGMLQLGGTWAYDAAARVFATDLSGNGAALGSMTFQVTQMLDDGFMAWASDGSTYRFIRH